jgi:transposase
MRKKVVFKRYEQNQPLLLPPSLEDLIPEGHPVRVVNEVMERISIGELEQSYKGGGTSSYHPRMLLKVLVYGYLRNIYSARKLEQAVVENIHFMWLAGGGKPDHNTLNDFRGKRLKGHLQKIFSQVVVLLAAEGVLSLKELTVDGTKLEANANRYTFVWGKAIRTSRERIEKQLNELWKYVEEVYQAEENTPTKPPFKQINPASVSRAVAEINEALKSKEVAPKVKQKLNHAKKNWAKKLREYEEKEKILAGRNSYAKTDEEATFMRMKDDHLRNGQLKPGYNLQASTNGHYVVNYTLGQTTTDTNLLKGHLENHQQNYGEMPGNITTDAGYGSEENYEYLAEKEITAFVKYNYFEKEQTSKKHRENPFLADNLYYNAETDTYYCPIGQPMKYIESKQKTTANGYRQNLKLYQARNCRNCPLRAGCYKAEGNRIIERNQNLIRHRQKAKALLESEIGVVKRRERWKVEAVFGNIKHNKGFKRLNLRGLEKAEIEVGLIALAHNLNHFGLNHSGLKRVEKGH